MHLKKKKIKELKQHRMCVKINFERKKVAGRNHGYDAIPYKVEK